MCIRDRLNTVHGGFAYLLMTEDAMIGALDPNGFRPLSLGKMKNGAYVLASETLSLIHILSNGDSQHPKISMFCNPIAIQLARMHQARFEPCA